MRIVLGVSGGVAAYKAVLLLRLLREQGHRVRVVPTASALRFVGAPTGEALSGGPATAKGIEADARGPPGPGRAPSALRAGGIRYARSQVPPTTTLADPGPPPGVLLR